MGFSGEPSYVVQDKIYTGFAGASTNRDVAGIMSPTTIQNFLTSTFSIPNPNTVNSFFGQFFNGAPMPSNIDQFISTLITFTNAHGGPGNTALVPPLSTIPTDPPSTQIKTFLLNTIQAALMLQPPSPDGTVMSNVVASATFTDIYEQAFKKFIQEFQYTGTTVFGTTHNAGAVVDQQYFADRFNEFFFQLASVADTTPLLLQPGNVPAGAPLINFQDIFTAYLGNNATAFENFLANYINEMIFPANGRGQSFIPSQNVGDWLNQVQQAYTISLKGSGAPLISSVGQTTRKTDILLTIYALLVKMIGTLQKLAAAQSDRLQLLATWTGAYTTLETQVPTFTAGDGTIFGGKYGNTGNTTNVATTSRDDANSLNQTFTETIRSRRTQIDNAAKSLQNNLNQSNDTANQQSDAATTILQNLRSILTALYR